MDKALEADDCNEEIAELAEDERLVILLEACAID